MEHRAAFQRPQRLPRDADGEGPRLRLVAAPAPDPYDAVLMARPREPDQSIWRAALIPLSLVVVFFLYYAAKLPFGAAASASVPFLALFLLAPLWAKHSTTRFDRDVVRLLTTDAKGRLEGRLRRAVGMRLFAPPAWVHERRGLVASETGAHGEARQAYRKAMKGYEDPDEAPMAVLLGYAHASYALGDDIEAIRSYRKVLATQGPMPKLERNLAHSLIRRDEDLKEAMELLDRAEPKAQTPAERREIALIRALGDAKRGRRATAKDVLREHRDAEGDAVEALVEELREELGA